MNRAVRPLTSAVLHRPAALVCTTGGWGNPHKMDIDSLPTEPITHASARGRGLSPTRLRRAIRQGLMRPVLRGVYLRSDLPLTLARKLSAAALVVSPAAVACDRTAAWIWVSTFTSIASSMIYRRSRRSSCAATIARSDPRFEVGNETSCRVTGWRSRASR